MSLTKQQLAEMDAIAGVSLTPDDFANMDAIAGVSQQPQGRDLGAGYAALSGFNAAVPFGERITAGLGSVLAAPFVDKPIGQIYDEMRQAQTATAEANPASRIAGTVGGIAATLPAGIVTSGSKALAAQGGVRGAINAIPQATAALGNRVAGSKAAQGASTAAKVGSGLLRSGRAAAVALPAGALYGAGEAEAGKQLEGAARGAGLAAAVGGALPIAGAALGGLAGKVMYKSVIPGGDEIKQLASQQYARVKELGGSSLKAPVIDSWIDDVARMRPQTVQGQALAGDDIFTKLSEKLELIRGQPMTLDAAQEVDEFLGQQIDNFTEMGRLKKEGQKLLEVQSKFRDMIENAGADAIDGTKEGFEALKEGRKLWSASRRMSDIERIIERASMTDNPATAIKNGFRTLASNPNKMRGFSEMERIAIKKAGQGGPVQDVFRTFGSRLMTIATPFTGAGLGGTAAVAAANMASRGVAEKLAATKAADVARAIASRAGLAEQKVPTAIGQQAQKLLGGLK